MGFSPYQLFHPNAGSNIHADLGPITSTNIAGRLFSKSFFALSNHLHHSLSTFEYLCSVIYTLGFVFICKICRKSCGLQFTDYVNFQVQSFVQIFKTEVETFSVVLVSSVAWLMLCSCEQA